MGLEAAAPLHGMAEESFTWCRRMNRREATSPPPDQPSTTQSVSWPFEVSKFTPTRVTGRPLSAKRLR